MKNVQVSVIVATYNIQNYIERCLESLVNQTLKEIEIIAEGIERLIREPQLKLTIIEHLKQEKKGNIEEIKCFYDLLKEEDDI